MSTDFVHLHVHSDLSLLDGACRVDRLCAKVKELGQTAVAVTDHGAMSSALEFYLAAKEAKIKPIIGCEFYLSPAGIADHSNNARYHLVLLAMDYQGYQSLCKLNALAWSDDGYYYKPRIDRDCLRQHQAGLICLSACVAGEIQEHVLANRLPQAREAVEFYLEVFGRERFYLELQYHGKAGQRPSDCPREDQRELLEYELKCNLAFREFAQEYGIGLVATNDAHYLNETDFEAHDALLCIGTGTNLSDEKRLRFSGDQFYVKDGDEMAALFADFPEAVANSVRIAERCNLVLPVGESHYPVYRLPNGSDAATDPHCPIRRSYLRQLCVEGLVPRYGLRQPDNLDYQPSEPEEPSPERRREIVERLDFELGVIDRAGYISYFLVVWDFIRQARSCGIPVGPGRGSGAGSLVAYLTGITDLDPLHYGLLFERFLNPDRVSPPDFDIDFCERRRGEVIDYVRDKYGSPNVAQIGTFGTLKAKAVLKDVARVMGVAYGEANALVAHIPTDPKMTLKKALEIPEVQRLHKEQAWVRDLFKRAMVLEGLNRNQSIHACGVVIGDQELANVVPLARASGNREWITQFPASPCEKLGLLKMDFLGLKTLTIIQDAIDMINARTGGSFTPNDIPLDNARTYELLNRGATVAVFQLESGGMQDLCRSFGISKLEEIIALVALYRPGPMEFIPTFINCKLGREKPEYELPVMEQLLSETFGIMVYQEQIMQVVQAVAGFSLAGADVMRRAIGKKDEKVLREQGAKFMQGCAAMGHSAEVAERIWQKILKFAQYGFNKSHSACYGLVSYRTAYLKANHPAEFMAAVLNGELNNAEKQALYIAECGTMKLSILPPDVNSSALRFGVADGVIRFGLGAIKGLGESAAEAIIVAREQGGAFKNLADFCDRVGGKVNKRVMENLARAGAFDTFGLKRAQLFAMIEPEMARAQSRIHDREVGQGSLFDLLGGGAGALYDETPPPDVPEWDAQELLRNEKELLGFYVTGHPIDQYAEDLRVFQTDALESVPMLEADAGVRVGGFLAAVLPKRSKKDNRAWAILTLESRTSAVECLCFADAYEACQAALVPQTPVIIEGHVSKREEEEPKIMVSKVLPLDEAQQLYTRQLFVTLREGESWLAQGQRLLDICRLNPGPVELVVSLVCESGDLAFVRPAKDGVANSANFRQAVADLLGPQALHQKADRTRPEARRSRWKRPSGEGG